MKQEILNGIKLVTINVGQMRVFVIINNVKIKINVDINVKN